MGSDENRVNWCNQAGVDIEAMDASGKPCTQDGLEDDNMLDGNEGTFWKGEAGVERIDLFVDLGQVRKVDMVNLFWGAEDPMLHSIHYRVLTSRGSRDCQDLRDEVNNAHDGGISLGHHIEGKSVTFAKFPSAGVRYVK